ncbi:probable mediator of RNA polymerase II transcription subunit 26b [Ziziphus jujuba]|uniref:Probable mediator of RNA polymerase II transcription subunit 26b n=1 Tax=Ziziphus jujuba TaxID=326968 RepID=A0A6P4ARA4_ZIZJJ|nr:probable mediator of RNA polymerase II transcription subunit 26b [Ziziphus jujuba]
MAKKSGSLDYWRNYFRTANSDIFGIIDHAIMVAASDCPKEFRLRRDRIAERVFSCRLTRCSGCDRVELAVPGDEEEDEDGGCKSGFDRDGAEFEAGASKESKVNSSRDDQGDMNTNQVSNYSYGEAEALTDEIEEASQILEEVSRIKEILRNCEEESESVLFESLRRLQLMALTVDTLKATEIGKAVNGLRRHGSKQICHLARTLIDGWKVMVDEWVNATEAVAGSEGTPDSANPSYIDDDEEEGLPSPPLDEGAFFATQPTSMELSQFFDGMDDDGNPRNSGEFIKNRANGRRPSVENQNTTKRNQQSRNEVNILRKENKIQQVKKEAGMKPGKPVNAGSGPGRPPKLSMEQKIKNETKFQQKSDKIAVQRRPAIGAQDKFKCSDEVADQVKLEATKRKLQERYQQAENAKKQRTIQVMELHDLPKQGLGHRNPHVKPGNRNRHWTHGRR